MIPVEAILEILRSRRRTIWRSMIQAEATQETTTNRLQTNHSVVKRLLLSKLRKPSRRIGAGLVLAPICIALLVCTTAPDAKIQRVLGLRGTGKFEQALAETNNQLGQLSKDSPDYWRFLLLKVQLAERPNFRSALPLLAEQPPPDQKFATIRSRLKTEEAYIHMELSELPIAEKLAQESAEIAAPAKATREVVIAQLLRAQIQAKLGRYADAEQSARDANARVSELNDRSVEAYATDTLAHNL
ncbi:MAG: hypothetical protein JO022_00205, partial [Acidobacteriaceae bacterium]|nr:hypothetical protein [Acidobacteriaceae bacterium]